MLIVIRFQQIQSQQENTRQKLALPVSPPGMLLPFEFHYRDN